MAGALMCLAASPGWAAGTLSATVTATPALGEVVSGAAGSGTTTFTVTDSSGAITQAGGSAVRVTTGTSLVTVTATCGGSGACATSKFKIVAVGSPSGRMGALGVFNVAAGTMTPSSVTGAGTGTLTFKNTVSVPHNGTETFLLGMAIPISDNTNGSTGAATAQFEVEGVAPDNGTLANLVAGTATATVFRPIGISFLPAGGLVFGTIIKPPLASGNGTVSVNDSTGARTLTGTLAADPNPSPSNVTYTVTGEGGQAFTITVPATVAIKSGTNSLTVTLTSTKTGSQTLSNAIGSAGTFSFSVGGSIPVTNVTPSGAYTATFAVTVAYN